MISIIAKWGTNYKHQTGPITVSIYKSGQSRIIRLTAIQRINLYGLCIGAGKVTCSLTGVYNTPPSKRSWHISAKSRIPYQTGNWQTSQTNYIPYYGASCVLQDLATTGPHHNLTMRNQMNPQPDTILNDVLGQDDTRRTNMPRENEENIDQHPDLE